MYQTRIGGSTTFSLQGVAVSRRIIGESSVSATLSHLIRPGWHASVTGTIGDQMGVSTSLQHTHRNSSVVLNASAETIYMPPRISVVGVRHFNAHNTGSITLSPGSYSLGSWGEGYEGLYDGSCTLAWHKFRAKDQISAILTAGTAESSASANYICSLGSDYRAKISCGFSNRRGLTSLIYASRRATRHLRVGCGVEFAAVTGTTFVLRYVYLLSKRIMKTKVFS